MRRFGWLSLLTGFALGVMVANSYQAFQDRFVPGYIGREEAIRAGMAVARTDCLEISHKRSEDCRHFRLGYVYESNIGWHMGLAAADGGSETDVYVGRRGEID